MRKGRGRRKIKEEGEEEKEEEEGDHSGFSCILCIEYKGSQCFAYRKQYCGLFTILSKIYCIKMLPGKQNKI